MDTNIQVIHLNLNLVQDDRLNQFRYFCLKQFRYFASNLCNSCVRNNFYYISIQK